MRTRKLILPGEGRASIGIKQNEESRPRTSMKLEKISLLIAPPLQPALALVFSCEIIHVCVASLNGILCFLKLKLPNGKITGQVSGGPGSKLSMSSSGAMLNSTLPPSQLEVVT